MLLPNRFPKNSVLFMKKVHFTKYQRALWLLLLFPAFAATYVAIHRNNTEIAYTPAEITADIAEITSQKVTRKLSTALQLAEPDTMASIPVNSDMQQAMMEQINYLRRPDVKKYPIPGLSKREMLETLMSLQKAPLLDPVTLKTRFDFYQVNTDLKKEAVRITGYYTPIVKASHTRTADYNVPLLRRPKSGTPSPEAIQNGALEGQDLELAWVRSKREVENAQLQGSCLIEFPDGNRQYLGFGGSVKGKGGVYVFFTPIDDQVLGCGAFPLTAGYSAAIDPRFIPIGASLLAELPELNAAGKQVGTTYRILFAQDRGGAIKTTKRMDLYCGVGQAGLEQARRVNRYGRLWLLLPKKETKALL